MFEEQGGGAVWLSRIMGVYRFTCVDVGGFLGLFWGLGSDFFTYVGNIEE